MNGHEFAFLVGINVREVRVLRREGLPTVRFSRVDFHPFVPAVRWYVARLRAKVRAEA